MNNNQIEPENVEINDKENVQWLDDNESLPRRHGKPNNVLLYLNNLSDRPWNRRGKDAPVQSFDDSEADDFQQQMETSKKVLELETKLGLSITQVNGQRKLGPPPEWIGPPPGPECEVFVGKIPRDLYEDEIYPIFRCAGDIYEIRLMMHFSGLNRGYCFVMYMNVESARKAIKTLNNYEIRPGRKVGVVASVNNCRLSINQLPPNLDGRAFVKKIYAFTGDVSAISVFRFLNGQVKNIMISYKTHIGAAMGRRRLVPERSSFLQGAVLSIDWAHPDKMPYNVIEEIWGIDEHGNVEITGQHVIPPKKSSKTNKEEFLDANVYNDENFGNFMPTEQNNALKSRNYRHPSALTTVGKNFGGEVTRKLQNFPKKSPRNSRVLRDLNINRKIMRTTGNLTKESSNNLGRSQAITKNSFEKRNKENYSYKNPNFTNFSSNYSSSMKNPSRDLIKNFNQLNLQSETFVRKEQTQNFMSSSYNPLQIAQNSSAFAVNWPVYHEKNPNNGNIPVLCVQMSSHDANGNTGNFLMQNFPENFPSFHENQSNLCINNAVLRLAPKFDTRAFGLGKINQDPSHIYIQNYEAMIKTPRPILRNLQ